MPCKEKKNQSPCTPPSRRLLETLSIKDLCPEIICGPVVKHCSDPGTSRPGSCDCDQDDCSPGRCCSLDRQCENSSKSRLKRELESLPCKPECKVAELEAIINDIQSCRDFFRKLALEANDIIDSRNSQQECIPKKKPSFKECCSKHGMGQKSNNVDSGSYSGFGCQFQTKLHSMPTTPQRSFSKSCYAKDCSVPIAQAASKIKEGRIYKDDKPEEKKNTKTCKDFFNKLLGTKPSQCSCNDEMFKQNKLNKPSQCSCEDEMIKQNKENEKILEKKNKKTSVQKVCAPKESDCNCDVKGSRRDDCFCDDLIEKRIASVNNLAVTSDSKDTDCPCCFPPAYSQYFNCTGQVTGNCHCGKNV